MNIIGSLFNMSTDHIINERLLLNIIPSTIGITVTTYDQRSEHIPVLRFEDDHQLGGATPMD